MKKKYPLASTTWDQSEIQAMNRVIDSMKFTMGQEVFDFESDFAKFFGAKYAVMSNSGSSANLLALAAIKYSSQFRTSAKNEVIVPAVSWSTTYYPISQLGYKIKFVDIDINTLNLDLNLVQEAISDNTAGIFAVNLLGNPSDLVELRKLADENSLFLIEDNCESMGAKLGDKFAGTFGQIGTFSSFYSHHISTMEGGMCLTDDLELAQIMISLRAHGWTRELPEKNFVFNKTGDAFDDLFRFILPGYNLRPLELSGAIGKEQIKKLPNFVKVRRENAKIFSDYFMNESRVRIQKENGVSSWFGFSLILEDELSHKRSEVVKHLENSGIDCRPIVAGNFAKNPVLTHLNHADIPQLPMADKIHVDGLFVGNHHFDLSKELKLLKEVIQNI